MSTLQKPIQEIDLDGDTARQVVVDRQAGQYLGHVSTVLLEDGKTILCVYPKGHGKGAVQLKRSEDGGKTWSERLPTPKSWETSLETPTIHRTIDLRTKKKHLILWSGLYPARLAHSEDDGRTWSELEPVGEWGGIVVMGFVERLRNGDYMAMFHDDGRFFQKTAQTTGRFTLYKTLSHDGGLHWDYPQSVYASNDMLLCEPGLVRSPDGKTLAVLLRKNARKYHSQIIFSHDEGKTWSLPRALPLTLTGDRHTARYTKDGRLVVCFRDMPPEGPWKGAFVAWVGTWDDLVNGHDGQYRVRLKDNLSSWDCGYPGVEVLPDGTVVATTYGHWTEGQEPYILSFRFKPSELDAMAKR
ncbi:MAG: exo-alpha-sialidase [Armatimonadetes bacterium]|nr:exo-alpha-sialidase [Armatimonadota bacterium]